MLKPFIQIALKLLSLILKIKTVIIRGTYGKYASKRDVL